MKLPRAVAALAAALLCAAPAVADAPAPAVAPAAFGSFEPRATDFSYTINAGYTPDGNTVYFTKSGLAWSGSTIFVSTHARGTWSAPEVAPFSGRYADADPAVAPDGSAVFFASMRPPLGKPGASYGLYRFNLRGAAAGTVEPLPPAVNGVGNEVYPSVARDGTLYFIGVRDGRARIFRAPFVRGAYQTARALDLPGDAANVSDLDATTSPDQRFLVFSSNRPDSLGGNDLYVAFRKGDGWCAPMHLDAPVNSAAAELATGLSPDGRTLYFASNRTSLTLPRSERVDAAGFAAELRRYDNGLMRTYADDSFGAWVDAHAARACLTPGGGP